MFSNGLGLLLVGVVLGAVVVGAGLFLGFLAGKVYAKLKQGRAAGTGIKYSEWFPNLLTVILWVGVFLLIGKGVGLPVTAEIVAGYCSSVGTVMLALAERKARDLLREKEEGA